MSPFFHWLKSYHSHISFTIETGTWFGPYRSPLPLNNQKVEKKRERELNYCSKSGEMAAEGPPKCQNAPPISEALSQREALKQAKLSLSVGGTE